MRSTAKSVLIQPILGLSCIIVLLLSTNAHLISKYQPSNQLSSPVVDRLAAFQIHAQTQFSENRIQKINQLIRLDHPIPSGLPIDATGFSDQLVAAWALNGINKSACSGVYSPNLHDRAPPLHIRQLS